jgi:hypothetical protein
VRKLLSSIGQAVPFSKAVRLGKPEHSSRPLRITSASITDQYSILKAAVKLRDSPAYSNVYINKDMTPSEQKNWKRLQEVKKKKIQEAKDAGREDVTFVIRRGVVIEGRGTKK